MGGEEKWFVPPQKTCDQTTREPASPAGTPITTPTMATRTASPSTILVTSPGSAPSAARNPSSPVRWLVEYTVTPYRPSAASTNVTIQKNIVTCTSSTDRKSVV